MKLNLQNIIVETNGNTCNSYKTVSDVSYN